MKNITITILKTLIGFIAFWVILYLVCLITINNTDPWLNVWEKALDSLIRLYKNIQILVYLTLFITIFSLIINLIVGFVKNKLKKVKFDYKNEYQKFKPKTKVKISFMDGKGAVTKNVHITSINAKGISFEDKENVYECTPDEIKNIRKRSKKLTVLIVVTMVFVLMILTDALIRWTTDNSRKTCDSCIYPDPVYIIE